MAKPTKPLDKPVPKKRKTKEELRKEAALKPAPRNIKMSVAMAESFRQLCWDIEDDNGREPNKQDVLDASYDPNGAREMAAAQKRAAYTPKWKKQTNPPLAS
jgi:hypothetical protein